MQVNTAIKFLQNENVIGTSLRQKRDFLEAKGLTGAEIDEALTRTQARLQSKAQGYKNSFFLRNWLIAQTSASSSSYFIQMPKQLMSPDTRQKNNANQIQAHALLLPLLYFYIIFIETQTGLLTKLKNWTALFILFSSAAYTFRWLYEVRYVLPTLNLKNLH